ncbi:MAG: hypothetical protein AAF492_13710, partial [Verrucomicrobiota bacterium]
MSVPGYFLSYSRKDLSLARTIIGIVCGYGIRIWQDLENLGLDIGESKVRQVLDSEVQGVILLVTRACLDSGFIKSIELPHAMERYKRDPSFPIIPIFFVPLSEAEAGLKSCLPIPIGNFSGIDGKSPDRAEAAALE